MRFTEALRRFSRVTAQTEEALSMAQIYIDQVARARRAWPYLVDIANRRGRISYGDLCSKLKLHHRAAGWFLGVIQNYCRVNGLPPLQALAVNKATHIPGSGYAGSSRDGRAYRQALEAVYRTRWSKTCPF
jgi:hypothetical protein